jgi:NADH:ubiquinone oxidoreductase subunit 5 (subunit L)/multisubunit Na+/H+ antiporter MnhA subunit
MIDNGLLLPSIVFLPFIAAVLALCVGRLAGRWTGILMVLAATASFLQGLWLASHAWQGAPVAFTRHWIPALHIALGLRGDPFGLFFALLISGIGALVGVYSLGYMPAVAPRRLGQFYAGLLAFMGAMLGVALSDDLVLFFVFWEITSLTSFLLIGFWYEQEEARKGAMTALQVTALGGMVMMAGFIIVGIVCGTFSMSQVAQARDLQLRLVGSPLYLPALLLILVGALTKSAQWPFHFWLPKAMVAPTPVSTYLHAATMVKAGVFLLGRMLPLFGAAPLWAAILVPVGLLTFLLGAYQALVETDLKALLARSTVSALGLFTMIYGLGAPEQDALGIFAHAMYKGALFLVAGIVEHAAHTRDIRQLGGLRRSMPITFAIALVAALSMAGLFPTLGFHAKEALYEGLLHSATLEATGLKWIVIVLAVAANALIFAASARFLVGVFLGEPAVAGRHVHEGGPLLWLPAGILAALALLMGLLPAVTEQWVNAFSSHPGAHLHVSLVPASRGPVVLSVVTMLIGILAYWARKSIDAVPTRRFSWPTADQVWDRIMDAVTSWAIAFSTRWQSGSLRWYLSGTLVFTVGLTGYALWRAGLSLTRVTISLAEMQWYGVVLCALLSTSAVLVVRSRSRIGAAIALTANGFLTALLFVVYRSPDILLTQILIETASTIFILLILYFMPPFKADAFTAMTRVTNLAIAAAVGLVMFTFILLSTSPQFRETHNLALDYLTRSLAEAGGANAVNVIIVDFRAIDTNGEITVLVVVGLLVFGLLRARRKTT